MVSASPAAAQRTVSAAAGAAHAAEGGKGERQRQGETGLLHGVDLRWSGLGGRAGVARVMPDDCCIGRPAGQARRALMRVVPDRVRSG